MGTAKRLLLVEDDPDIRESVTEILQDVGYEVVCADDGAQALASLKTMRPALVLLDLMMPGMNGVDFLTIRKDDPELASIPVVLLTADSRIAERVQSLGANATLRKPFDLKSLLDIIERHVR